MPRSNKGSQKSRKASTNGRANTKLKDLQTKPDKYLECRSYTYHAFIKIGGLYYWADETGHGIARFSECQRGCGMLREDFYDRNNKRVFRRYYPPEDYGLVGNGKITNADVMGEIFKRAKHIAPDRDSVPGAKRLFKAGNLR